jgi:hypothetical protein
VDRNFIQILPINIHPLGAEERCHYEGVSPWLWNVVGVIRPVVRDGRLGPPKV